MNKVFLVALCMLLLSEPPADAKTKTATTALVFWNLENFFDYRDGGEGDADHEFSPWGARHWTRKRFYIKCNLIAKSLLWMGDYYGQMPDIIGLAEVENAFVLRRLLQSTALKKLDYGYVHYDSPDPRGIDVALLYRRDYWKKLSAKPCRVGDSLSFRTRDILHVRLSHKEERDTLDVMVCHLPSKYGGTTLSEKRRKVALERLRFFADSLARGGGSGQMIAMGDFNDTPDQPLFRLLQPSLNLIPSSIDGTIRYEGRWEWIDLAFVSRGLLPRCRIEKVEIPFLMTRDASHPGDKPLRTYSGPRYLGGVSDHCPIVITIY